VSTTHKPGNSCPSSGQYAIVWKQTGANTGVERTVVAGKVFPPTPKAGQVYILVDKTRTSLTRRSSAA